MMPPVRRAPVQLAGYWQLQTENENEPGLQTIVNKLAGYGTVISNTQTPNLPEGATTATYYGEEVVSPFWNIADSSQPISVIQIDGFSQRSGHEPDAAGADAADPRLVCAGQFNQDAPVSGRDRQRTNVFPLAAGTTNIASATFNPGSSTFGWYLDGNYSEDSRNTVGGGGGHHVRFYPVRDQQGNLIPNTWLVSLDYGSVTFENYDFQDLVFLVNNMRPSTQPAAPDRCFRFGNTNWNRPPMGPVSGTVSGYNVYRGTSATGSRLLNSSPQAGTSFLDTTAPAGSCPITESPPSTERQNRKAPARWRLRFPQHRPLCMHRHLPPVAVQLTWNAAPGTSTYRIERRRWAMQALWRSHQASQPLFHRQHRSRQHHLRLSDSRREQHGRRPLQRDRTCNHAAGRWPNCAFRTVARQCQQRADFPGLGPRPAAP